MAKKDSTNEKKQKKESSGKNKALLVKKPLFSKKKKEEKPKNVKLQKMIFTILALLCIALYAASIAPKKLQNDTFYTVKIGQYIRENGIDNVDHFSWQTLHGEKLPYTYPHWLYDVIMSLIYDYMGGFMGIYISTAIFSALLGISLFITHKKYSQNDVLAFLMTFGQLYMVKSYITARAQLVTFILFVLTIFFIDNFLTVKTKKWRIVNAIMLIIIPILLANLHVAVFPFYFVIYMPYIAEFAVCVVRDWHLVYKIKKIKNKWLVKLYTQKLKKVSNLYLLAQYKDKLAALNTETQNIEEKFKKDLVIQKEQIKNPFKVRLDRNNWMRWLIVIMLICLLTGLITPLAKDTAYTYTLKTMMGNSMDNINEHLPLNILDNKPLLWLVGIFLSIIIFTKTKIRFRDLLFIFGLLLLAYSSRRQVSMLVLLGGFAYTKILYDAICLHMKKVLDFAFDYCTTIIGAVLISILVVTISISNFSDIKDDEFISKSSYPIKACIWIKENIDYENENTRFFNDYNYGSYMMLQGIPVFIDSRCDLYTPEFNGKYDFKEGTFKDGKNIFSDYLNISQISSYYTRMFQDYKITHVITKSNSKLHMLMEKDELYNEIYSDEDFTIYEFLPD